MHQQAEATYVNSGTDNSADCRKTRLPYGMHQEAEATCVVVRAGGPCMCGESAYKYGSQTRQAAKTSTNALAAPTQMGRVLPVHHCLSWAMRQTGSVVTHTSSGNVGVEHRRDGSTRHLGRTPAAVQAPVFAAWHLLIDKAPAQAALPTSVLAVLVFADLVPGERRYDGHWRLGIFRQDTT